MNKQLTPLAATRIPAMITAVLTAVSNRNLNRSKKLQAKQQKAEN
jgi:hypothetical protein